MVPEGIGIFRFPPSRLFSSQLRSARSQLLGQAPKGEGGPEGRVRGAKMFFFTPHPTLRVTLSLRERDSQCTAPVKPGPRIPA
jgi:hypothetical protein